MKGKNDQQFVRFLQWALPHMGLRWPGFRKVRGQVRKRVNRRITALNLTSLDDYQKYLNEHKVEWSHLDHMCRITISRFYRNRGVFDLLKDEVLPILALQAADHGQDTIRCWSCGCASGEEPYTLALIWHFSVSQKFPEQKITILGTDADPVMLQRAEVAFYSAGSLKEVPEEWKKSAFQEEPDQHFSLKTGYKKYLRFMRQDIRETAPADRFHLILCRNLVFTYFDQETQKKTLDKLYDKLESGGVLIIGSQEHLPATNKTGFVHWISGNNIFRKGQG